MIDNQVLEIVFSSTAAVYGEPQKIPIEEKDLKNRPILTGRQN